jgi:hypothetical protein
MNMKTSHKIAVIFDVDFGMALLELADEMYVWVASSEKNDAAVKAYASQVGISKGVNDPLSSGVTKFEGVTMTPALLDTIWEHHGEYAHEPPLAEMKVIGLALDKHIIEMFEEFDFEVKSSGSTSFEAYSK